MDAADGLAPVGTPEGARRRLRLLWRHREVLLLWTRREILAQYSQTAAGVGWALLQPLLLVAILAAVFHRVVRIPSEGAPALLFYLAAIVPWTHFQSALLQGVPSLQKQMYILSKIYFPREVIPLAVMCARLLDLALGLAAYLALALLLGRPPGAALVWLPVLLLVQVVFTAGVLLWLSAANVFVRDLGVVLPFLTQVWLYASPVLYPLGLVPERWRWIYVLNPMAPILDGYRRVLLHGLPPGAHSTPLAAAVAVFILVSGYAYFKRLEPRMADVV